MPNKILVSIMVATIGSGQAVAQTQPAAPAPARTNPAVLTPVPVPRTAYLESMDGEFKRMDRDGNGVLTANEIEISQRAAAEAQASAQHEALFNELDSDRNGQLSKSEFDRARPPTRQVGASPLLGQADLNKDQKVTLVEYRTAKLGIFDRMDADKDGIVSVAELRAAGIVR